MVKTDWNRKYGAAALTALAAFVLYLPALRNEFVYWDDNVYIYENPHLRPFTPEFFRWAFLDSYAGNWHPLAWLSHGLDYALWGLNPFGHHLTNIILHSANTFLVVVLAAALLEIARSKTDEGGAPGWLSERAVNITAAGTGLLFAVHPLHVESAAWVSERKDLLCAFFFLPALIVHLKGHGNVQEDRQSSVKGKIKIRIFDQHSVTVLALFLLALGSKPMAVTLPAVLLILDWYPLRRITNTRSLLSAAVEKAPLICLSFCSAIVTLRAQQAGGALSTMDQVPLFVRTLVAMKSLLAYLGKMIAPSGLVPFYPYPNGVSLASLPYASALALVAVISGCCLFLARKRKLLPAVWLYFVVTLLPVIGIVQAGGQALADRYTYLPSVGPFLVAALALSWIMEVLWDRSRAMKRVAVGSTLLLLGILSLLTIRQISTWRDSITLWTHEIEQQKEPVALAYVNRGVAFQRKGLLDKAAADYEKAIEIDPAAFRPYISLGTVFEARGEFDKAREALGQAIALNPSSHEAYRNRGILDEKTGRLEAAVEDFTRAIEIEPSYFEAYNSRGIVYGELQQFERAIADYTETIRLNPFHFGAYTNRAIAYTLTGKYDDALRDFDAAILLNGNNAAGFFNRAAFYRRIGNYERARADLKNACSLGSEKACRELQQAGIL